MLESEGRMCRASSAEIISHMLRMNSTSARPPVVDGKSMIQPSPVNLYSSK
jgi:hypothetical protein